MRFTNGARNYYRAAAYMATTTSYDTGTWLDEAKCADRSGPNMFPNELVRPDVEQAKDFCRSCPVKAECLNDALDRGEKHGIWGGMDYKERSATKRHASRAANRAAKAAQADLEAEDVA